MTSLLKYFVFKKIKLSKKYFGHLPKFYSNSKNYILWTKTQYSNSVNRLHFKFVNYTDSQTWQHYIWIILKSNSFNKFIPSKIILQSKHYLKILKTFGSLQQYHLTNSHVSKIMHQQIVSSQIDNSQKIMHQQIVSSQIDNSQKVMHQQIGSSQIDKS